MRDPVERARDLARRLSDATGKAVRTTETVTALRVEVDIQAAVTAELLTALVRIIEKDDCYGPDSRAGLNVVWAVVWVNRLTERTGRNHEVKL
jgi:hypothetical protein